MVVRQHVPTPIINILINIIYISKSYLDLKILKEICIEFGKHFSDVYVLNTEMFVCIIYIHRGVLEK